MKKWVIAKWIFEILSILGLLVAVVFFISLYVDGWNLPSQLIFIYIPIVITMVGWFCCLRRVTKLKADVVSIEKNECEKKSA